MDLARLVVAAVTRFAHGFLRPPSLTHSQLQTGNGSGADSTSRYGALPQYTKSVLGPEVTFQVTSFHTGSGRGSLRWVPRPRNCHFWNSRD